MRRQLRLPQQRARMDARGPGDENVHDENRLLPEAYENPPLFHRCYFKKSAEKIVAVQRLGGNSGPLLFSCC
jgi:hypothetical protein